MMKHSLPPYIACDINDRKRKRKWENKQKRKAKLEKEKLNRKVERVDRHQTQFSYVSSEKDRCGTNISYKRTQEFYGST